MWPSHKSYDEVIAIFANAMQQILQDAARRKRARKRIAVDLSEATELPIEDAITIAAAVAELGRENPRQAQIVRCRFLLGMTTAETAAALRLERERSSASGRTPKRISAAKSTRARSDSGKE